MGNTTIAVLEEVTQVVEIVLPGPQGPVGDIHPSMPGLVQQATDAATSATASALSADTSEANASASAAAALASKDAAAASEASALASKNAAATSATSASGSATTATTKASEASTSATNAADSATAAATSATDTANALVGERSAVATLTNKTITNPVIDSGTANGVTYLNGSRVLAAGSGLTYNGSALQINAESYPSLKLGNAAGVSKGELYFGVGGDDLNLVSYVAGPIVFKPGNAEQMRLTSTGLGIGTSSPACKLDVFGTGTLAQFSNGADANLNIKTATALMTIGTGVVGSSLALMTSDIERMRLDASGNLGLGVVPSSNSLSKSLDLAGGAGLFGYSGQFELSANAYYDSGWRYKAGNFAALYEAVLGQHIWKTAPSGVAGSPISFTQAMTLSASGGLMVGTSTDYGERLHVSSAGAGDVISMRIAASQENGANGMARRIQWSLRDSTGSLINTNSIRSEWSDVGANSAKLVFTSAANNAQADAMTLDSGGNLVVGGTGAAGARISASAGNQAAFRGDTSTSGASLILTGNNSNFQVVHDLTNAVTIYNSGGGIRNKFNGAVGLWMVHDASAGLDRMTLDASGRLGIGTSSPNANLDVAAVNPTARINAISGGIPTLSLFSSGVYDWRISGGTALSFVRDATTVATLDASGNLGIGTSSPAHKLDVAGYIRAVGNGGANLIESQSDTQPVFRLSRIGGPTADFTAFGTFAELRTLNSYPLVFSTNSAERARIDTNGNLLVGKTAQSSGGKLEVAGNVVCQPSTAAPTLAVNGEMSFQLVSDTSLKILVRGSDGITRSTTLTLT